MSSYLFGVKSFSLLLLNELFCLRGEHLGDWLLGLRGERSGIVGRQGSELRGMMEGIFGGVERFGPL